jgi:pyrroline-5-carboxylate reductase
MVPGPEGAGGRRRVAAGGLGYSGAMTSDTGTDGLAILGCGKIGEILATGLAASGWRKPDQIVVTSRRTERTHELSERHGFHATTSNLEATRRARILVIAVKPTDVDALLAEIATEVTVNHLVISVAAAISTSFIDKRLPLDVPVVRAMPNAPSQVGSGIAGICAGSNATTAHLKVAEQVLSHVGKVVVVAESAMDAVTAVSGSGPAYFALLAESMIDAGIMLGLSRGVSTELVVQTMLGTARLLGDAHMHPFELREAVTSPGGTTIMAIRELERAGVRAAMFSAIQAAMERSRELAAGHE